MQNLGLIYKELFVKLFLSMVDVSRQTGQMEFRGDLVQNIVRHLLESESHLLSVGETVEDALETFFDLIQSHHFGIYEELGKTFVYRFPLHYSHLNMILKDLYTNLHTELNEMNNQISIKDGAFPEFPSLKQHQNLDLNLPIFKRLDGKDFNLSTIEKYKEKFAGKIVVIEVEDTEILAPVEDLEQVYKICNSIVKAYVEGIAGDELQWVIKKTQRELKISPDKLNSTLKASNEDKTFYWLTICTIANQSVESRKHFVKRKQIPVKIAISLMNSYLIYQRDQELKREIWSKQVEKFVHLIKEKDESKENLALLDRRTLINWMKEAYIGRAYEGNEFEEFVTDAFHHALEYRESGKWLASLTEVPVNEHKHYILRSRILPLFKKELVYLIESRQVFRFLKRILKEKILAGEISPKKKMSRSSLRSYGRLIQSEISNYLEQNDYVFYVLLQNPRVVHSAIHDTSSQPFKDLKLYFLNESSMVLLPYLELFGYKLDSLIKSARRSISLFEWIRIWMRGLIHRNSKNVLEKDSGSEEERNEQVREENSGSRGFVSLGKSRKSTLVGTEKYKQPKNISQASDELKKAMKKIYRH